jgi:uncharacterized protein (DUF849 family)
VHCRNGDALPLAAWAITQGGHVSIGLGDYPYSRFGKPRNSDLVGMVADMARTLGRPVATPDQAREILRVDQLAGTASPARARASSDGRTQGDRHRG